MKKKENHYRIRWDIDIWAETPERAAFKALTIMHDEDSLASNFDVTTPPKKGVPAPTIAVDLERYAVCYSSTCGHIFKPKSSNNLAAIPKLLERIEPGHLVPSCECPKCGCLAYPALKMIK